MDVTIDCPTPGCSARHAVFVQQTAPARRARLVAYGDSTPAEDAEYAAMPDAAWCAECGALLDTDEVAALAIACALQLVGSA